MSNFYTRKKILRFLFVAQFLLHNFNSYAKSYLKKVLTIFFLIIYLISIPQQTNAVLLASNLPTVDDFNFEKPSLPEKVEPKLIEPKEETVVSDEEIKFTIKKFNFIDNTVLTDDQLSDLTEDFLNKDYNFTQLQEILRLISGFYRQLGLWARAILPEQDIVDGILTIQVVEGKLGRVIVETDEEILNLNADIAKKYVENLISNKQILNINQVEKNIATLNKVPGISAVAT